MAQNVYLGSSVVRPWRALRKCLLGQVIGSVCVNLETSGLGEKHFFFFFLRKSHYIVLVDLKLAL